MAGTMTARFLMSAVNVNNLSTNALQNLSRNFQMKTLKCPVCGKILDLVDDHSLMVHMGNFHYENRSAFYYVCRKCQIATEYGKSKGEAWEKARRLIDKCLGKFEQKGLKQ